MNLNGRGEYLEVKWRLLWLRTEHPEAIIETELVKLEERDYIADVIFSRPHLSTVIAQHDLYPHLRGRDPTRAIEQLRDDLELQVWRTDVEQRHPELKPTRSTRVTVASSGARYTQ